MLQHWPGVWEEHEVGALGAGDLHHACWQPCHTLTRVQRIGFFNVVKIFVMVVQLIREKETASVKLSLVTGAAFTNLTPEQQVLVLRHTMLG